MANKKTIIAEIGQNHCGDMTSAEYLIRRAKMDGADLVKFQLYDSEVLYGKKQNTELTLDQAKHLFDYGREKGIEVFFSAFDKERVDWCRKIGVHRLKIASSKANDTEFIEYAACGDMPIIISIYGTPYKLPDWIHTYKWLFCVPHYPTELMELHFNNVSFGYIEGFSDHTVGLDAAMIALSRGAQIIEKHFAIDHKTGVDSPWSMTPSELRQLRSFADSVKEAL